MPKPKSTFWSREQVPGLLTNTYIVERDPIVHGAIAQLRGKGAKVVVGADSETIGLDPLTTPNDVRLIQLSTGDVTYVFDLHKLRGESRERIRKFLEDPAVVKVIHNGKFDLKFWIHCLGLGYCWPLFDTLLGAQLLDLGDEFGKHDLGHCAKAFLGVELVKDVDHNWAGELTQTQLVYASNDAAVLPPLRAEMLRRAKEKALIAAFVLEFQAVQPTALMELNGFMLDRDKWGRVTEALRLKALEVAEQIMDMLPVQPGDTPGLFEGIPRFNLGSNEQLKERLLAIGIELPKITDEETGEEKDTLLSDKMAQIAGQHKIIPLVIQYSQLRKAVNSYGKNFLKHINPADGRAHADFRQIGTVTTRYSVSKPPLHGIPKKSDHRECFVARPGYKLVWGDYSQIELRILAEFSQDKKMIQAFLDGEDFHAYTASSLYSIAAELVDEIQRRRAKDLNFGVVYGVGDRRFAEKAGITLDQAKVDRGRYARTYPEMTLYLENAAGSARVHGYCHTMSGKVIDFQIKRLESMDFETRKKAVGAIERHGKNYPIQGSSADITKRALKLLYDRLREDGLLDVVRLVHCVHDEIVLEVREDLVDQAREILRDRMVAAGEEFLKTVPVVVDTETNDYWKKRKDD